MSKLILLVFIFVGLLLPIQAQTVSEFSLKEMVTAVDEASQEYRAETVRYLLPLATSVTTDMQHLNIKINRGDFYFKKGDYISASDIYYSIFSSQSSHNKLWEESLYKLGRALFFSENYISAMRYFELLLSAAPESMYKVDVLKDLIEAAYRMGNYDAALKYYTAFVESGADFGKYPDLIYFLAKSLYMNDDKDEAFNLFSILKQGDKYYLQARYFVALIELERGEDAKALKHFLQIVDLPQVKGYWKFDFVRTTAILAVARLYFEQGSLPEATQYYLMVDHKSPLFSEAYYELCWTYIRRKMYTRAISALALIRYISPSSVIVPEAELLEGTLMIQTNKLGEAMVHFSNLVTRYTETQQKLLSAGHDDLVNTSKVSIFSPLVQALLNDSVKYKQAVSLKKNLAVLESELKQVVGLKDRLESALSNDNLASLYPPLKKGSEFSFVFHNKLVHYLDRIHLIMYEKAVNRFSAEDAKKWRAIQRKKQKLATSISIFPLNTGQFKQKTSAYVNKIVLLTEELHRSSLQTKALLEQVTVLETLIAREDANSRAVQSIQRAREFGQRYEETLEQHQADVGKEKNRLLLRGDLLSKTIFLRREYETLLRQEGAVLRNYLHDLGRDAQTLARIENDVQGLMNKTDVFSQKLNRMVRRTLGNIRAIYESERIKLEHYLSEEKELESRVDDLARLALFSNINKIKETFGGIILQADQGIINVAWERKDNVSQKLLKYRTEKARELQRLNLNLEDIE
ncbi:tetratricopeptide repeat protein [bacterium]|nr:tetratricopeptide repeat protein [bacterium]